MAATTATKEAATPRGTSIRPCSCTSRFQDAQYGQRMRVHNARKGGWRCTVCSREAAA